MEYGITISGEIGSWWNGITADYVRWHLQNHKDEEVHVGFCSLGGSVKDALEMNQAFRDHGNVHAHAFAMNASASTLAMLGCKSIDIVKNSFFLIHNASLYIDKWESQNKEQIDEYIKELKTTRDELATIDGVLAQMYADKTGKSIEDIQEQMNKGTWMNADTALEWGLVDSIREDKAAEKVASNFLQKFKNNYNNIKETGIPPIEPATYNNINTNNNVNNTIVNLIADSDGNPTDGFLRKTWEGIRNLFIRNQQAEKKMIKIFNTVAALLNCADGFAENEDGTISLTQDQVKTINDEIDALNGKLTAAKDAQKAAETSVQNITSEKTSLEQKVKDLEEQVKNLKAAPGDNPNPKPANNPENYEGLSIGEIFNLV